MDASNGAGFPALLPVVRTHNIRLKEGGVDDYNFDLLKSIWEGSGQPRPRSIYVDDADFFRWSREFISKWFEWSTAPSGFVEDYQLNAAGGFTVPYVSIERIMWVFHSLCEYESGDRDNDYRIRHYFEDIDVMGYKHYDYIPLFARRNNAPKHMGKGCIAYGATNISAHADCIATFDDFKRTLLSAEENIKAGWWAFSRKIAKALKDDPENWLDTAVAYYHGDALEDSKYYKRVKERYVARWPQEAVMNIKQKILTNNDCYKKGRKIKPKGIMVHSTASPGVMANAWPDRWNKPGISKCVHAFVDDQEIIQTLPWDYRGWHAGYHPDHPKDSANGTHIGFEICEPGGYKYDVYKPNKDYDPVAQQPYFEAIYDKAIRLCVYLCKKFAISPDNIIDHHGGYKLGVASNHGDVHYWWRLHGKSIDDLRAEVRKQLGGTNMPEYKYYIVNTKSDSLNVRKVPFGAKVGSFPKGEIVRYLKSSGGWMHVESLDGNLQGWVSGRYLKLTNYKEPKEPPVVVPPPVERPKPNNDEVKKLLADAKSSLDTALAKVITAQNELR